MAEQDQEQNKTEDATPFKLRRARERGMVARSLDLGFFGSLAGLAFFLLVAGPVFLGQLAQMMRAMLGAGIAGAGEPQQALALVAGTYRPVLEALVLLGVTLVIIVLFLEILQLRGIVFSTQPLKPDFSRLNPAKGLKRIFSLRMLKEAIKNVVKLAAYALVVTLIIRAAIAEPGRVATDAQGVASALHEDGMRLLFLFIGLALFFAGIDQVLVRREYAKQMRMSRRELTREVKEREGEPRLKQKRKQFHAEFAKQAEGIGKLPGSDLLVVNPQHIAVALAYDPQTMAAPTVAARARGHFALRMKREAARLGIPIFENRPLARQLFQDCSAGAPIGADHYRAVAALYLKLRSSLPANGQPDAQTDLPEE
jgi:flagellar biosynthetic protein FlhB